MRKILWGWFGEAQTSENIKEALGANSVLFFGDSGKISLAIGRIVLWAALALGIVYSPNPYTIKLFPYFSHIWATLADTF